MEIGRHEVDAFSGVKETRTCRVGSKSTECDVGNVNASIRRQDSRKKVEREMS